MPIRERYGPKKGHGAAFHDKQVFLANGSSRLKSARGNGQLKSWISPLPRNGANSMHTETVYIGSATTARPCFVL